MNTLLTLGSKILANKHTSGAAICYALAKFGCPILATWWPSHKAQLDTTAGYLEGAAVAYGFIMSGDATQSVTKTEADTTFVKKSDVTGNPT